MFALNRRDSGPATAQVITFPKGMVPEAPITERQKSYVEIATAIGFVPEELVRAQLLTFFNENDIKIYDYAEVDAYLRKKRLQDKKNRWVWRPLRQADTPREHWHSPPDELGDGSYYQNSCPPYSKLVPQPTLEKVAKIEKQFGNKVQFFVSDYAVPKPDPFIGVRVKGSIDSVETAMLVFDVWDEPGFGVE